MKSPQIIKLNNSKTSDVIKGYLFQRKAVKDLAIILFLRVRRQSTTCAWNGFLEVKRRDKTDGERECFLCLFTYSFVLMSSACLPASAIRISRKGWHVLLNFCFHTALTFAVFAGGINRIKYPIICQAVSAFPFHLSWCSAFFFVFPSEYWSWMSVLL